VVDDKTDTAIRAEGAELYVQAVLMVQRGLVVSQASRSMPGYDLLTTNLENGRSCRIQVKYRKAVNSNGMRVKSLDFDFIAYVAGNLGRIGQQAHHAAAPPPLVYIIPRRKVKRGMQASSLYKSPTKGGHDAYLDAWHLIDEFLGIQRPASS